MLSKLRKQIISQLILIGLLIYIFAQFPYARFFIRTDTAEEALQYLYNEKHDRALAIAQVDDSTLFAEIQKKDGGYQTLVLKDDKGWIPADQFSGFLSLRTGWIDWKCVYKFTKIHKDGYVVIMSMNIPSHITITGNELVTDNLGTTFQKVESIKNSVKQFYWYAHIRNIQKGYTVFLDSSKKRLT